MSDKKFIQVLKIVKIDPDKRDPKDIREYVIKDEVFPVEDIKSARVFEPNEAMVKSGIRNAMRIYFKSGSDITICETKTSFYGRIGTTLVFEDGQEVKDTKERA